MGALFETLPIDRPLVWGAALAALALWGLGRALNSFAAGRQVLRVQRAVENSFLALLILTMILLSFLQVVLRNFADAGYVWIDPLLRHLVLWVGFLGALLATRTGRHINIDALTRLLNPATRRVTGLVTNLLATTICLLLTNATWKLAREEWMAGTEGFLGIPIWFLQLVMPLACFGMAVRFLARAEQAARGVLRHEFDAAAPDGTVTTASAEATSNGPAPGNSGGAA